MPYPREVVFTGYVGPIGDGAPVVADSVPVETSGSYELDLVAARGLDYVTIAVCVRSSEPSPRSRHCGDEVLIDPNGGPVAPYCTFSYGIVNIWGSGWQGEIGITPLVDQALSWQVIIPTTGGTTIGQVWNANVTFHRGHVEFWPPGWGGPIPVGATYRFGFIGSGPMPPMTDVEVYVNGVRCVRT
jgi:hypothetical protein